MGCRCATSWCELDLTFDFAVVTLNYKILSGLYPVRTIRYIKLILGRHIVLPHLYVWVILEKIQTITRPCKYV